VAISIRIEKHFTYRGANESWANTYHFSGGTPADLSAWTALVTALKNAEAPMLTTNTHYDRAVCYANDSDPAVHIIALSGTGGRTAAGQNFATGDSAFWVRWGSDKRDSRGHPIYARCYYHDVLYGNAFGGDAWYSAQATDAATFGAALLSGLSDGGSNTYVRCLPDGTVCNSHAQSTYIGRRKLKRRG